MYGKTYYSPLLSFAGLVSLKAPLSLTLGETPEQRKHRRIRYGSPNMSLNERFARKVAGILRLAIMRGNFGDDWTNNKEYLRLRHALEYYEDRAEYYAQQEE